MMSCHPEGPRPRQGLRRAALLVKTRDFLLNVKDILHGRFNMEH